MTTDPRDAEIARLMAELRVYMDAAEAHAVETMRQYDRAEKAEAERDAALAQVTVKPGEIERAVWSAMIWAASNNAGFDGVPEYTDRGNSFAEDEARRAAARILAALLPAGESP